MSSAPKVLLLDVMDTLVKDPFFTCVPAFFGRSLEELWALRSRTAWEEFEKGNIDEDEYHRTAFLDGRPYDGDALRQRMVDGYEWLPGVPELLAELSARGVEMHALSNYPRWFELLDEKLALSRYVRWTFVSCKTGVRKPDPRAYLLPVERLERQPEELLFVDDREKNCAAAREVGLHAHRFTDAEALRATLRDFGLL
jgi:HAD superfamily hydrolase (TIGR01509 family)